jgi:predicted small metal-binding protein
MARKYVDCRDVPGSTCTVVVSAESEDELVEACVDHAVKRHHEHDTPELREMVRKMAKEGAPPV